MKTLRVIPLDSLCQECKRGRMIKSTMPRKAIKPGLHYRSAFCRCDRCGHSGTKYFKYVGVETD